MADLWTCPYCNRPCTVSNSDVRKLSDHVFISEEYGYYRGIFTIIVCPNHECREKTIFGALEKSNRNGDCFGDSVIHSWNLLPESQAKPFPDFIPLQLRNDYSEACLIKEKSPKASATLSRRCLQGIIRDFWKIKKNRLVDEIDELKDKVDSGTWGAIDSVRKVGNIGAHMEKDVNLIIDVEPKEAGLLIWLIETLFEEWYIVKHDRDAKMKALKDLATAKNEAKNPQTQSKITPVKEKCPGYPGR